VHALSDAVILIYAIAADHGFCDGAQHQRQDRFRESPFDTAIFVLQNDAAAKAWPASDSIRDELFRAMAQGKPSASGGAPCHFVVRVH
jgi:phosphorylated CTD-interacting factor 1